MSTKTMKQRIALVAVSALTAGVLSVASAPVANAAADATFGSLWLATTNSTTGAVVATGTGGDTALDKNIGFVAVTSADVPVVGTAANQVVQGIGTGVRFGGTGTANVLPGAALRLNTAATNATTGTFNVALVATGGTFSGGSAAGGTVTFNGTNTAVSKAANAAEEFAATLTVNPGATSVTVTAYEGTGVAATTPTAGSLMGRWVLTVVAASASGVVSTGDSSVFIGANATKGVACTAGADPTFDNLAKNDNGKVGCIFVDLFDAYGAAIASTGNLQASATGGSLVVVGGAASDAFTAGLPFDSATYTTGEAWISVLQPVSNTAGSTTVTITYQGVVLATKTISWNGIAATIELDAAVSASTFNAGGSSAGTVPAGSKLAIVYKIKDAAGNIVTFASQPTVADATGGMIAAQLETAAGAATEQVVQSISAGKGTTTMYIASSAATGAGTYKLSITNSAGTVIKSAELKATVVGSVSTFTASWDKASYTPGEIATLTIKGLDSAGRPAADGTLLGTGTVISVNTDGLGHLTSTCETTPATSSAFAGGQKTCKFAVKNEPGSYSYSVKVATSTSQSEVTGTIAVAASSATVSNADVLKSIVALIASINKQIQALQKLILKR